MEHPLLEWFRKAGERVQRGTRLLERDAVALLEQGAEPHVRRASWPHQLSL